MGSTILDPVPPGSIDRFGLSIVTATRDGINARMGTIYEPARFAAAIPVHFHPLGGSRYLGLFDGYWNAATPSTTTAGRYTAHTEVDVPAAAVIDAATGQISVPGGMVSFGLPIGLPMTAAASSTNFVMTLHTGSGRAELAHWTINRDGSLQQLGAYSIPDITADGQAVCFDRGVYFNGPWIYLWGHGLTDHRVYTARQYISKLGSPWLVQTDDGWSTTGATPVGDSVTTVGPMSTVVHRGITLVTTVDTVGSNKVGVIWSTRSMTGPWIQRFLVTIDSTAAWLGGGLMLQPQVAPNPESVPTDAAAGIPWVRTTHAGSAGNEALVVSWGLYAVAPSLA